MNEGGVDHAIRSGCSAAQAFEIIERTAMHIGPCRGKGRGRRIRTSEAEDRVSRGRSVLGRWRSR